MIGWGDVYKVVAAMAPLYFALGLGYGSVRWWKIFTPDQCVAVNLLVNYFAIPFYAFDLAARTDPFELNYRVLAADALSKLAIALAFAAWAAASTTRRSGVSAEVASSWCITGYAQATLKNVLVLGAPLMDAMYGKWARDLIMQIAVMQVVFYYPMLLLAFEVRRACTTGTGKLGLDTPDADGRTAAPASDVEGGGAEDGRRQREFLWPLVRVVWRKMARNPNFYAGVLGVAWALVRSRWHIETPSIIDGSVLIMSRTGVGLAMFSMGQFMALQEKVLACGARQTALGMVLRFVAGPAAVDAGAFALGLRGGALRVAIIQAALPQSIATFVYAREYGLHADVLSTAVIFGTLVSLPVLIVYYIALGFIG